MREIPQKPYTGGSGEETGANLQVPFFPKGFTVSTVLSGNLGEIVDAGGAIPTVGGKEYPEKRALHIEVRALLVLWISTVINYLPCRIT